MTETVLLSLPQHRIKFYFRFLKWLFIGMILVVSAWVIPDYRELLMGIGIVILAFGFYEENARFKNSVLELTEKRVLLRVKKGLFKSFEVGLHYEQIINCSYVKKNILHSLTNSGTLYVRASEKPEGQIIADFVPNVEKMVQMINHLITLSPEKRIEYVHKTDASKSMPEAQKSKQDPIEILQKITGIHGVKLLPNELKKFIFLHEEDRNHGVFEALGRKYTYVILHGDEFRIPDAPIVHSAQVKVIFPPVPFHELKGYNAISGSPGIKVHKKLLELFPSATATDATVLVGVDE